jgi:hypothetical protein
MTKCDLLEKKIKNGVCVKKPLNDAATVTKYELSWVFAYMDGGLTLMNIWL